ncbi:MAG: hypothetical protein DME21_17960 [Verrucomicrobia bacterium]|nr:MAG: hypothetical protein DME21_17960 [Verrucomicrobiota bacterium]
MATQSEFLRQLWNENINGFMSGHWIDNAIKSSQKDSNAPFADVGPVLKRLQSLGASKDELGLIARFAAYEASFELLYMLNDPGIDDGNCQMLHESLLGAEPSGKEGRSGSWPI